MRLLGFVLVVIVTTLLAPTHDSQAQTPPPKQSAAPISLDEVRERGIAGRLGLRMGTIIEVSGLVVENKSSAKADADEPYFLRIDFVNGKKLPAPQLFAASSFGTSREMSGFRIGEKFKCIGYERGRFSGVAEGEFKYVLPYATRGFGLEVDFVILKIN